MSPSPNAQRRIAIYGWGLVAPRAPNIDVFASNLASGGTWLQRFDGFGSGPFLIGNPEFDFSSYEAWIGERFAPSKAKQLRDKMDPTTLFAIGSFIQGLSQNPGVEEALRDEGAATHVYVGNALGAIPTISSAAVRLVRAQRRWGRYWSHPSRNTAICEYLNGQSFLENVPVDPSTLEDQDDKEEAEDSWFSYWAPRSSLLQEYLKEFTLLESVGVGADVDTGKMKMLRDKRRRWAELQRKWGAPPPPWTQVSANVLWNISSSAATQITMLGRIVGPAMAPAAACSTFSMALECGMEAIRSGRAKITVVGATDPAPHSLTVGSFYDARVLAADGEASIPLSQLKGTHVAGGACIWIIADREYGDAQGWQPLGLELVSVGLSSDAEHIITPSQHGPRAAISASLHKAGVQAAELSSWDLHATATPGDYQELKNLQSILPSSTAMTARKGTFGHGMGVSGGWELTAQHLGVSQGTIFPTALTDHALHESIRKLDQNMVLDQPQEAAPGPVGKLSMGVGGINACVVSRPWADLPWRGNNWSGQSSPATPEGKD